MEFGRRIQTMRNNKNCDPVKPDIKLYPKAKKILFSLVTRSQFHKEVTLHTFSYNLLFSCSFFNFLLTVALVMRIDVNLNECWKLSF